MSIDKESSGMPEFDPRKRTTKVNLFMVVAIGVFLAFAVAGLWWLRRQ